MIALHKLTVQCLVIQWSMTVGRQPYFFVLKFAWTHLNQRLPSDNPVGLSVCLFVLRHRVNPTHDVAWEPTQMPYQSIAAQPYVFSDGDLDNIRQLDYFDHI